ncbi:helix-turn-helix transcriptional regulator [Salinirubellus sp. GCM10025818]|uniref:helix-turn-helix transcriptional regulator n=1 Tax=Salinirubellus TaxID=2162630 RepID=UPI0030D070D4
MGHDSIPHQNTESPIGDIAYLARSEHRVPTLVALTERPRSRSELCELTGVSSSTIRRTLDEFEDRNWTRKDGYKYEITQSGEAIASGMEELIALVSAERKLRDIWHWLPDDATEFALEPSSGVTLCIPEYDAPYRPINRYRSLLEETDRFRYLGVGITLIEPCRELFRRRVLDGMQTEIIDSSRAAKYVISMYPEASSEILDCDNMTGFIHDDVPSYGLNLFDDRIAISGCDPDSGSVKGLIDTDASDAREWAESVYASYKSDARPLESTPIVE